jgi:hypothetical protein
VGLPRLVISAVTGNIFLSDFSPAFGPSEFGFSPPAAAGKRKWTFTADLL